MTKKLGNELKYKDIKELEKQLPKLPTHIFECNDCLYTWESDEDYTITSGCPRCHCGDLGILDPILEDDK